MNYILIASPDKISLNNFIRQLMKHLTEKHPYTIGEMHSLMSHEAVKLYVEDFKSQNDKGILSYYAKRLVTDDPLSKLPESLITAVDTIIWFDLYSTEPKVLKAKDGEIHLVVDKWKDYVKQMGGPNS